MDEKVIFEVNQLSAFFNLISHSIKTGDKKFYLPEGFEQRRTAKGKIYYVDHNHKSTSWTHPLFENKSEIINIFFSKYPMVSEFLSKDTPQVQNKYLDI